MNPLLGLRKSRSGSRARADRTIDREYEALRDTVLRVTSSKLRQIDIALDPRDLEAAYNQAWHALYQRLAQGAEIENRTGFLVTTAFRRAIDEHRVARPDRYLELPEEVPAADDDLAQQLDDQHRLRALRAGMRERLDDRELRAATLCYLHGCTRKEAAEILGVAPRRMEKVMDRVSKRMSELVADVDDDWCEQQRSLIQAYALGVLDRDGERYPLAVAHLEDCAACRRRVLMLRGLTAVAPPLPLLLAGGASVGGGAPPSGDRAEVGAGAGAASSAMGAGRAGLNLPATAAIAVIAVIAVVGVTIGVVLLVDGNDRPPVTAPSATAPASPAGAPPRTTTVAERERAADQRRARAARKQAERRRAERARARRAAATAASTATASGADGSNEPAAASPPASQPTDPTDSGSGTTSGSAGSGSSSSSGTGSGGGSGSSSGSSPSSSSGSSSGSEASSDAGTDVVTDGAEEFDLGD